MIVAMKRMVSMKMKAMVKVKVVTWLQALAAALRATKAKSLFGALRLPSADFKLHLIRNQCLTQNTKIQNAEIKPDLRSSGSTPQ